MVPTVFLCLRFDLGTCGVPYRIEGNLQTHMHVACGTQNWRHRVSVDISHVIVRPVSIDSAQRAHSTGRFIVYTMSVYSPHAR